MTDTDRPEVDDPRVLALAQARQQMAHENQFNAGFCPPWDGLTEQEQRLSLLDARNYLRAALKAGLLAAPVVVPSAPATRGALRDRGAEALSEVVADALARLDAEKWDLGIPDGHPFWKIYRAQADAVLAVLPETDQPGLLAKVDEATATLRRIRSTIRALKDRGATGYAYHQAITDDLAGPRPDHDEASGPSRMADEAQQIQCADAFWDGRPHAPHDWRQRPDAQPVRCPGVGAAQQPETQAFVCKCPAEICHCGHHAVEAQQPECSASRSGHCLREAESEIVCDTEAGECVHGGRPAVEAQQPETQADGALRIRVLSEILSRLTGSQDGDSATDDVPAATVRKVLAEILTGMQPSSDRGRDAEQAVEAQQADTAGEQPAT